jgi:hypothetical protein
MEEIAKHCVGDAEFVELEEKQQGKHTGALTLTGNVWRAYSGGHSRRECPRIREEYAAGTLIETGGMLLEAPTAAGGGRSPGAEPKKPAT